MCYHRDCALHRLSESACAFISHGLVCKQASLVATAETATRRDAAVHGVVLGLRDVCYHATLDCAWRCLMTS